MDSSSRNLSNIVSKFTEFVFVEADCFDNPLSFSKVYQILARSFKSVSEREGTVPVTKGRREKP